jgi:hypothetical protein
MPPASSAPAIAADLVASRRKLDFGRLPRLVVTSAHAAGGDFCRESAKPLKDARRVTHPSLTRLVIHVDRFRLAPSMLALVGHADLIELSLRSYINQLDALLAANVHMSAATKVVARGARLLTSQALEQGAKYEYQDPPPLRVAQVGAALARYRDEALQLANVASLGLGCATPELLIVGKEPAATAPRNFMLEMLVLGALWRTDAPRSLMSALLGETVTFPRFPTDPTLLYGQQGAGHTWSTIERLLENVDGRLSLWDSCYIIDLGHIPADSHQRGPLLPARVDFLVRVLRDFAESGTRVAVFHSQEPYHDAPQQQLIAEFVSVPLCDLPTCAKVSREGCTRQDRIEVWRHGDRSAVRCRHLSRGVPSEISQALVHTLRDVLSTSSFRSN